MECSPVSKYKKKKSGNSRIIAPPSIVDLSAVRCGPTNHLYHHNNNTICMCSINVAI